MRLFCLAVFLYLTMLMLPVQAGPHTLPRNHEHEDKITEQYEKALKIPFSYCVDRWEECPEGAQNNCWRKTTKKYCLMQGKE